MTRKADKSDGGNVGNVSAKRLRTVLSENNLTQAQLAEMIGLEEATVSAIVCGKRTLTKKRAQIISELFTDAPAAWLLGLSDMRTEAERENWSIERTAGAFEAFDALCTAERLLECHGYRASTVRDMETGAFLRKSRYVCIPADASAREAVSIIQNTDADSVVRIVSPDGKQVEVDRSKYDNILEEIDAFAQMRMAYLFRNN